MSEKDKDTGTKEATSADAAEETKAEATEEKAEAKDESKAEDEAEEKAESKGEEKAEEKAEGEEKADAEAEEKAEAEEAAEEKAEAEEKAAADDGSDDGGDDDGDDDGDDGHGDDGHGDEHDDEPRLGEVYGLLAEYNSPGELIAAAEKVRDAGFSRWDCYSPFPVHGIDPAMGIKRTILPWIVFAIGLSGLAGGLTLQWWANAYNWPWIISGKPFFSIPANIPITFETTILASAFATFFSMWILNKLPQVWHPFFKKDRFLKVTDDGFFIGIEAEDPKFSVEKTEKLLRDAGSSWVEVCRFDADPNRRKLPKPLFAFIITTIVLTLIPLALVAKARTSKSPDPHVHIFPDMDFQESYKAQNKNEMFDNKRSSRPPVKGTVARNHLKADDLFYRGLKNGAWATTFPSQFPVGKKSMARGQQRFGIYCAPCHGADGQGNGMVQERTKRMPSAAKSAWAPPSNLIEPQIVQQPHGQLFNTISHGIRTMPAYSAQIPEEDRWAIVLYLRALQRSQNARLNDVPSESRNQLQ